MPLSYVYKLKFIIFARYCRRGIYERDFFGNDF